ncbi:FKBP-type peptidyl-prolyl cis-trans isomerase [Amycolatopsis sp. CA-230715]|uniref:FKBP-type peptidyl-prolyl cis-trans isomerase n=1 Tax=Amycolatopsis sp. CA-230715 TaxID=2745196 RepID=UPI001C0371B1|nr:FKBP-type peptidyl-prolyl cis-trans isomerase [Amycolatopsis sp. CA-230715]QWF84406.1 hypothetical protein HUW46_07856 [Amycolatopsis sp. CA-230715]
MRNAGKIMIAAVAAALSLGACANSEEPSPDAPGTGPTVSAPAPAGAPSSASQAPPSGGATAQPEAQGKECTADDIKVTGDPGKKPEITIPDTCKPPAKLVSKDLKPGTGAEAKAGSQLEMNYELVTWSDKAVKDNSYDRGEAFKLNLGGGDVIPGWDQGLVGIKQGARRLLIIPPALGYKEKGAGGGQIKPNETLVFVVDAAKVS